MKAVRGGSKPQPGGSLDFVRWAPSAEKDWVEDFVLEQRLLGVPGAAIGDALVLVESHIVDSGESAREAFGEPKEYACQAAPSRRTAGDRDPRWLLGLGLGLVGLFVTSIGAEEWLFGSGQIHVTAGLLVTGGLLVAAFVVLILATDVVLRMAVKRTWLFLGVCALYAAAVVAAVLILDASVGQWSAARVTAVGVGLLALGTALEWAVAARGGLDDPIVGPAQRPESAEDGSASGEQGSSTDILSWLTVFLFPILTALMVGLGWVLHLMT